MKLHLRAQYLYHISEGILSKCEMFAELQTRDIGKCLAETRTRTDRN